MSRSEPESSARPEFRKGEMVLSLVVMGAFDIGLSIFVFFLLRSLGASETFAYLGAGVGPIVGMVVSWLRTRQVGGVSIIILVVILISALVSLIGSRDARILLLKDSVLTGGFGVVTLLSAIPVFPKPLMFYFGLKFATDGSRQGVRSWYEMWPKYPQFRSVQYVINTVWGLAFVVEALVKAACTLTLPYDIAYTVDQVLPLGVLAGVIAWTTWYGLRKQRQARARMTAAGLGEEADAIFGAPTGSNRSG